MTWVAVVKFWAYQAYQLQLIVYTNLTLTLHGLELFSSANRQWGRVSGTPNDYFISDGAKGYEGQVNTNLPIQFKNSALFAVANILTDAENVVDEKAECCNLGQGTLTLKIASSHQGQTLIACYFILGY